VKVFPEVTTGDLDPFDTVQMESQMAAFLSNWLRINHPDA
jgi:hypothetical protein